MAKKCGYCKGTGRRIQKAKKAEGIYKIGHFTFGNAGAVNERCTKCGGTGVKNK